MRRPHVITRAPATATEATGAARSATRKFGAAGNSHAPAASVVSGPARSLVLLLAAWPPCGAKTTSPPAPHEATPAPASDHPSARAGAGSAQCRNTLWSGRDNACQAANVLCGHGICMHPTARCVTPGTSCDDGKCVPAKLALEVRPVYESGTPWLAFAFTIRNLTPLPITISAYATGNIGIHSLRCDGVDVQPESSRSNEKRAWSSFRWRRCARSPVMVRQRSRWTGWIRRDSRVSTTKPAIPAAPVVDARPNSAINILGRMCGLARGCAAERRLPWRRAVGAGRAHDR